MMIDVRQPAWIYVRYWEPYNKYLIRRDYVRKTCENTSQRKCQSICRTSCHGEDHSKQSTRFASQSLITKAPCITWPSQEKPWNHGGFLGGWQARWPRDLEIELHSLMQTVPRHGCIGHSAKIIKVVIFIVCSGWSDVMFVDSRWWVVDSSSMS